MIGFAILLLAMSLMGILSFACYPLILKTLRPIKSHPSAETNAPEPTITVVMAVRNGRSLLEAKMANLRALRFPGPSQWIIYSDGSSDGTAEYLASCPDPQLELTVLETQHGKAWCLSQMFEKAKGEFLLFTDADALIDPQAITKMLQHFEDPKVGGVCGQRVIQMAGNIVAPQSTYIDMDSRIKYLETKVGSLTSNDGKLYLLRTALAAPIPGPVTDDLWEALAVVGMGYRMVFEPEALVAIPAPARSLDHEYSRRRRVVSTSLNGIFAQRRLLNPFRFGFFAVGLFLNKVNRRLLPFWILGFLLGCLLLGRQHGIFLLGGLLQLALYLGLLSSHYLGLSRFLPARVTRIITKLTYFLVGNLGMMMGFFDFLLGRTPDRWEPKKEG